MDREHDEHLGRAMTHPAPLDNATKAQMVKMLNRRVRRIRFCLYIQAIKSRVAIAFLKAKLKLMSYT